MTNAKLNELLGLANQAQAQWDKWAGEGYYNRSPEWKTLYRSARDAWTVFHRAIREAEPCIVFLQNGETRNIGTAGMLCSSLMMYYSEKPDAKWTMAATNLKFVASIEKVEDGLNNE